MNPPCEDCICLAICNPIYLEFEKLDGIFITKLKRRCSNIQSFLFRHLYAFNNGESSGYEANEYQVIKFYKEYNDKPMSM